MTLPVRVLIVCPEATSEAALPQADHRFQCTVVQGAAALGVWCTGTAPDILVLSLPSTHAEAGACLERLRQQHPPVPVLLLAEASVAESAERAIPAGVMLVIKPVTAGVLTEHILSLLQSGGPAPASNSGPMGLLGESPGIEAVRAAIAQVADADVTVLLRGESGTGKEVAARYLWSRSHRAQYPLIKVNCAAIPCELLESELFGYEAGAFTGAVRQKAGKFELAHRGTIFLDEISEMHPLLQAKLLHVLQDGEYCRLGGRQSFNADVRVVAATNVDLEAAVASGRFRRDLFYRLSVVNITMPALRRRSEDVPLLLDHYCRRYAEQYRRPLRRFRPSTIERLQRYSWPGNVRELENLAKRLVIMGDERQILLELETLPARLGIQDDGAESCLTACSPAAGFRQDSGWPASGVAPAMASPIVPFLSRQDNVHARTGVLTPLAPDAGRLAGNRLGEQSLLEIGRQAAQQAEAEAILQALHQTRWNRRQAARLLQVSYKALQNKLKTIDPGNSGAMAASAPLPVRPQ